MSASENPKKTSLFRGRPQPDPDERLAQIRIFLADEDYHRTLKFTQKLTEIEEYVAFLEKTDFDGDKQLLKRVKEMIDVHRDWIRKATQAPSTSYIFTRFTHKNRLLSLVKNRKRHAEIALVKAAKISENLIPGPALHRCMNKEDRPISPDPFLYTKQLTEIRRRQDTLTERMLDMKKTAVWQEWVPTNFNGPYTPFYKMTLEDITERRNIISETLKRLNDAAKLAPRPFIHEVISIIIGSKQNGASKAPPGALEQSDSHLTNEDIQRLLILAEPSWNSNVESALRDPSEDGSFQSAIFAQLIKLFKSDLWSEQNSSATLTDVFKRIDANLEAEGGGLPITIADVETFLIEMAEVGRITYDINTRTLQKPLLDCHPEARFNNEDGLPEELYRAAAHKLGYTMAHLESLLEDEDSNGNTSSLRDISAILSIKQNVEARYPLPAIDSASSKPQNSSLTQEQAAELLQKQIILEHNHNWDDRAPNFQRLWAFTSAIEKPKQFFALNRWPPELQTPERENEIKQSGPAPISPEQDTEEDVYCAKENEIFYPGETFFPFGETPYHEAILARQIDQIRPDAPIHRPEYKDPFTLPEFPENDIPALMDYAAVLGLGKRKRSVQDSNDPSSTRAQDKTRIIVDPSTPGGAASIPITMDDAAGYLTPQFTPETIGGVKMHVAESPVRRRRRGRGVRFDINASEGVRDGGPSNGRRGVGATTAGGKGGAKGESSGASGTTENGSSSSNGKGSKPQSKAGSSPNSSRGTDTSK